jgi:hypothetical protein
MQSDWIGISGLIAGIAGVAYAVGSDVARRSQRHWVHMAIVNLKPSIQGCPNRNEILASINNMLEFLKPPKRKSLDQPADRLGVSRLSWCTQ